MYKVAQPTSCSRTGLYDQHAALGLHRARPRLDFISPAPPCVCVCVFYARGHTILLDVWPPLKPQYPTRPARPAANCNLDYSTGHLTPSARTRRRFDTARTERDRFRCISVLAILVGEIWFCGATLLGQVSTLLGYQSRSSGTGASVLVGSLLVCSDRPTTVSCDPSIYKGLP